MLIDWRHPARPQVLDIPANEPLAISPDGSHAAFRTNTDRIDVFTLPEGKHVVGWRTLNADSGETSRVHAAVFVDNQRLLVHADNEVGLWELPKAKLHFAIKGQIHELQVSPGGQYALIADDNGVLILETDKWTVAGHVADAMFTTGVAWSADGQRLAVRGMIGNTKQRVLKVWDVATGKETASHVLQRGEAPQPCSG